MGFGCILYVLCMFLFWRERGEKEGKLPGDGGIPEKNWGVPERLSDRYKSSPGFEAVRLTKSVSYPEIDPKPRNLEIIPEMSDIRAGAVEVRVL